MKLYIGGAYQGQAELALSQNPGADILYDFHETVRDAIARGVDARDFAEEICRTRPDAVIVSDEVGSGVVPIDRGERAWREAVGRALCVVAQHADTVTRAVCGIGVRIK